MAPAEKCLHEMFALVSWEEDTLAVPLAQLEAIDADDDTEQAVADWRYWIERGYQL